MSNSAVLQSQSEPRHHLLIAGTGRAGTSVLVRILTACGFDTALSRDPAAGWNDTAAAGLETIPLLPCPHPYVVKSPWSYQFIRQLLDDPTVHLDGVLVPVRRLEEAAASRTVLDIQRLYQSQPALLDLEDDWTEGCSTPGGVIYSLEPLDVARVLAHSFHRLIEALVEREIPVHFLAFPRFCTDLDYCLRALAPILPPGDIDQATLRKRISSMIEPDKIRMAGEMAQINRESADEGLGDGRGRAAHADRWGDASQALPRALRGNADDEAPAADYPRLSSLHGVALKREVKRLSLELAKASAQLQSAGQKQEALTTSALDKEKAETTVHRAMRRVGVRLRETGNRLTGGGIRALAKRMFTKQRPFISSKNPEK